MMIMIRLSAPVVLFSTSVFGMKMPTFGTCHARSCDAVGLKNLTMETGYFKKPDSCEQQCWECARKCEPELLTGLEKRIEESMKLEYVSGDTPCPMTLYKYDLPVSATNSDNVRVECRLPQCRYRAILESSGDGGVSAILKRKEEVRRKMSMKTSFTNKMEELLRQELRRVHEVAAPSVGSCAKCERSITGGTGYVSSNGGQKIECWDCSPFESVRIALELIRTTIRSQLGNDMEGFLTRQCVVTCSSSVMENWCSIDISVRVPEHELRLLIEEVQVEEMASRVEDFISNL